MLSRFEPRAPRKLLLKRKQIDVLIGATTRDRHSVVPLDIHFNERGMAKVLLGVGEGRQKAGQAARRGGAGLAAGQGAADAGREELGPRERRRAAGQKCSMWGASRPSRPSTAPAAAMTVPTTASSETLVTMEAETTTIATWKAAAENS